MASTLSDKLQDPVCETTRKQRRNLLIFSVLGIVVAKAKLFPTEITALGIKFSEGDSGGLLVILSWVICYYLITFIVYSWSEFLSLSMWRFEHYKSSVDKLDHAYNQSDDFNTQLAELNLKGNKSLQIRIFFEFFVPLIIAAVSIVWLLTVDLSKDDLHSLSNNPPQQESTDQGIQQNVSPKGFE